MILMLASGSICCHKGLETLELTLPGPAWHQTFVDGVDCTSSMALGLPLQTAAHMASCTGSAGCCEALAALQPAGGKHARQHTLAGSTLATEALSAY
jgi:hypothetical protein